MTGLVLGIRAVGSMVSVVHGDQGSPPAECQKVVREGVEVPVAMGWCAAVVGRAGGGDVGGVHD